MAYLQLTASNFISNVLSSIHVRSTIRSAIANLVSSNTVMTWAAEFSRETWTRLVVLTCDNDYFLYYMHKQIAIFSL